MRSIRTSLIAIALGAGFSSSVSAELVVNGGFETGNFNGWTLFGNTSNSGVTGGFNYQGNAHAYFEPIGNAGGLYQDLATVAGKTYCIRFAVANLADPIQSASIRADFGTANLLTVHSWTTHDYVYYQYLYVPATTSPTRLTFTFQRDNPYSFLLDAVSVEECAVPEPSTLAMTGMALVLGGLAAARRGRKGASA